MASIFKDLTKMATDFVDTASDIITNKSELEKKLDEALSKANWGTPTSSLREIAAATNYHQDFIIIMRATWEALNPSQKTWRQVYKGLQLLEHLVKFGSERCVDDARDHVFRVRSLVDFAQMEGGKDQGAGIREIAKRLVELLNDTGRIREERKKSKDLANKFVGISNEGMPQAEISFGIGTPYGGNSNSSNGGSGSNYNSGSSNRQIIGSSGGFGRSQDNDSDLQQRGPGRRAAGGGGGGSRRSSLDDDWDASDSPAKQTNSNSNVGAAARHAELAEKAAARRPHGHQGRAHTNMSRPADDTPHDDGFDSFGVPATTAGSAAATNGNHRSAQIASKQQKAFAADDDFDSWGVASNAPSSTTAASATSKAAAIPVDDFDAFTTGSSTAASSSSGAAAFPQAKVSIALPRSTATTTATVAPRLSAPATSTSAAASAFDPFSGASAPAAAAPAAGGLDDLFGAPAPAPAPYRAAAVVAPAASATSNFDPFFGGSAPAPAASTSAFDDPFGAPVSSSTAGNNSVNNNPFAGGFPAIPAMNQPALQSGNSGNKPLDADVDRLVGGLGGFSLADGKAVASGSPVRSSAPLKALGAPGFGSGAAPKQPVMASGAPSIMLTPTQPPNSNAGFGGMGGPGAFAQPQFGGFGVGAGMGSGMPSGGMSGMGMGGGAGAISAMSPGTMQYHPQQQTGMMGGGFPVQQQQQGMMGGLNAMGFNNMPQAGARPGGLMQPQQRPQPQQSDAFGGLNIF